MPYLLMSRQSILRAAFVSLALALGAAACSDDAGEDTGDGAGGELFDFALVQADEFSFEADPTDPNRGIFRVQTTEPMICAIVWGETEAFGNFNNSLAMNGTGIVQHDVVLPGIEQGREYVFRVQGSTADGRQFRSALGSFTIPVTADAATPDIPRGDNLALDGSITGVSSEFGPGWEAVNAIDGDTTTEWATAGDGDGAFLTVDLGAEQEVAGVEFLTRSMLDGTATAERFTVTVDGDERFGPFPAGNPADPRFAEIDATGREFRFDVESSTGGNVGAIEVRILAPPDEAP